MANAILNQARKCINCGSTDRNKSGDCRPCQLKASKAWKERHKQKQIESGQPLYYTYLHKRKSDGGIFYVGKGKGGRAYSKKSRSRWWHSVVNKHGFDVEIVERFHKERDALNHEIDLIRDYKDAGVSLCNLTEGGDGVSGLVHSESTKKKLSEVQIGKKLSEAHKRKLSIAGTGRPFSDESKKKISIKNKGRKRTPQEIEASAAALRGRKHSDEHKKAISLGNTGHVVSDETRRKISKSHMGKTISEEHRLKISVGNKGKVRTDEFKRNVSDYHTGRKRSAKAKENMSKAQTGRAVSQQTKDKISHTLKGRKLSEEHKKNISLGYSNKK